MTKEVHALVIKDNDHAELRYIKSDLGGIKAELNGGYLEPIAPTHGEFGNWIAYVDEEGKLKGLPVNQLATDIARVLGWSAPDFLVGPVVFLGRSGMDEGDLPDEATRKVIELFGGVRDE